MWNRQVILFVFVISSLFANATDKLSLGDNAYQNSKFDSALIYYNLELQALSSNELPKKKALVLSKMGIVHEDLGNYQKALSYYENALKFFQYANDSTGVSDAYNQIGNIYYRWSDFENAIKYYQRSLSIKQKRKDIASLPSSYNNIGNIYYSWKKFEKSLEYYQKAIKIKYEQKDSTELASYLINIGSAYLGLQSYKQAKDYYIKALNYAKKNNNDHMKASCLINIGVLSFEEKNYSGAIMYYEDAKEIIDKTGNKLEKAFIYRNLGETYIKLKEYDKADENLKIALTIAKNENINELTSEIYHLLYIIEKKNNNFARALEYHELFTSLDDSIFDMQSSKKLNELQSRYEYEKKENELKQKDLELIKKQKQIQRQRLIFAISAIIIIVIFFIIYFRAKSRELKKRITLEKELGIQMQKVLSAQMNPHFISNALNSIQKFFLNNDIENVNEYLGDFGALIRIILENSRKTNIPLSDEINSVELYASLEALRLNNKFELEIIIDDTIDTSSVMIPSMIIQPFIENAIWHGIAPKESNGKITLTVKNTENHKILCQIEDNGIGYNKSIEMNKKYGKKHKSYAVSINRERLELLNKSSQTEVSLKITDKSEIDDTLSGTIVELIISN